MSGRRANLGASIPGLPLLEGREFRRREDKVTFGNEKGAIIFLFSNKGDLETFYINSQTDKQAETLRIFLQENFGGHFIEVSGTLINGEEKR